METIDLEEFLRLKAKGQVSLPKKRSGSKRPNRDWKAQLVQQIALAGLPEPQQELVFHVIRKWRFDLHWKHIGKLVACEVDGGVYGRPVTCHNCHQTVHRQLKDGRFVMVREGGRHNTGAGYEDDCEKLNEAALYGWLVLRVTPTMIEDGRALDWIQRALLEE